MAAKEEQAAGRSETTDLEAGAAEEEVKEQENAVKTETMEKKKKAATQTEETPTTEAEIPLDSGPSDSTSASGQVLKRRTQVWAGKQAG